MKFFLKRFSIITIVFVFLSKNALAEVNECPTQSISDSEYFENWKTSVYSQFVTQETRSSLLEEKRKYYCSGKLNYYKVATSFAWETWKVLTGGLASYGAAKYFTDQNNAGSSMALTSSLMAVTTSCVNNFYKSYDESALTMDEGLKYVFADLQDSSSSLVEKHSQELQTKIKALDNTIAQNIFDKKGDLALKCLKRREEVLLAMPTPEQIVNVAQYGKSDDEKLRKIIDARVDALVQSHPSKLQEPIDLLIQSIRDNSIATTGRQVQAYLYGPPGTGKTRFVKRIGEALGLHVCNVDLSKVEPDELFGPGGQEDALCEQKNNEVMGKIGACFAEAGVLNPIIFFDEAGEYLGEIGGAQGFDLNQFKKQMMQAAFKKLLDTEQKTLKLPGLGVSIDTSRATYLFAGNYPITNEALLSRIDQIHFETLTRTEKMTAAKYALDDNTKDLSVFLSDEDLNFVKFTASRFLDYILDEDEKRNPGARIIQGVIKDLVGSIRLIMIQQKKQGKELNIRDESIREIIQKSFIKRALINGESSKSRTAADSKE